MEYSEEFGAFLVTNEEVKEIIENIGWKNFISEIRKGFEYTSLDGGIPEKVYIYTKWSDMRCMPAYLPKYNENYCGVKIISVAPENIKLNIPTVIGEYLLRDARTQRLLTIMKAEELTAYRTGAATAVATDVLARKNSSVLGIIGTGKQAYYQIKGILNVRNIEEVRVYDIDENRAKKFKNMFENDFGVDMSVTNIKNALQADIITTITPSTKPFISHRMIKEGMHINGVGADSKNKIEFELDVLKKSKIFVDSLEQSIHSGEVYYGLKKKIIKKDQLVFVGDILIGKSRGRTSEHDITFFKSTGVAFQDLITAILVYEKLKK